MDGTKTADVEAEVEAGGVGSPTLDRRSASIVISLRGSNIGTEVKFHGAIVLSVRARLVGGPDVALPEGPSKPFLCDFLEGFARLTGILLGVLGGFVSLYKSEFEARKRW